MEEPLSDEVSPGVTLTTSAKISPTSETKKSAETTPKMKGEKTKLASSVEKSTDDSGAA